MSSRFDRLLEEVQGILDRSQRQQKCGARTRSGKPCRAPGNGAGGRCKLHGGKSTWPKTDSGRERCRLAVLRRWQAWRTKN